MNDNTRIRIHLSGKLFEALTKQIILESKKSKKILNEKKSFEKGKSDQTKPKPKVGKVQELKKDGALAKTEQLANSKKINEPASVSNKEVKPAYTSGIKETKEIDKAKQKAQNNEKKYKGPSAKQSEKADQTKPKPKVGKVMEKKTIDNKKKA